MAHYSSFLGLGIAGNFALHLQQAGEMEDFKDVVTEDEHGPKGMFPFYLPGFKNQLGTYPLSSEKIVLPEDKVNVQAEPEVALLCNLEYDNGKVSKIVPTHFGAYNDCSIRKEGAKKISEKKNWGEASKGFSSELIELDSFTSGCIMDSYRIASFLRRDGIVQRYGEDVELSGYSYFHEKLTNWMVQQMNTQKDFGPLEPLSEYIATCNFPSQAVISIGATRYTEYGEYTYLQRGDKVIVVLYNENTFTPDEILRRVEKNIIQVPGISSLVEHVE
jgi:hypothetical protein